MNCCTFDDRFDCLVAQSPLGHLMRLTKWSIDVRVVVVLIMFLYLYFSMYWIIHMSHLFILYVSEIVNSNQSYLSQWCVWKKKTCLIRSVIFGSFLFHLCVFSSFNSFLLSRLFRFVAINFAFNFKLCDRNSTMKYQSAAICTLFGLSLFIHQVIALQKIYIPFENLKMVKSKVVCAFANGNIAIRKYHIVENLQSLHEYF